MLHINGLNPVSLLHLDLTNTYVKVNLMVIMVNW